MRNARETRDIFNRDWHSMWVDAANLYRTIVDRAIVRL
jgi:hypothetical protein